MVSGDTQFETVLKDDPGNPLFAEFAENLRREGTHLAALSVCLAGLSANPTCHRGRLVLARVFFDLGYHPFAVRELEELSMALPKLETIKKLLAKFDPGSAAAADGGEETIAETEFDISEIELATKEDK